MMKGKEKKMKETFDVQLTFKQKLFAFLILLPGFLFIFPMISKNIVLYLYQQGILGKEYLNLMLNLLVDVTLILLIFIVYKDFLKKTFIQFKEKWFSVFKFNITFGLLAYFSMNMFVGVIITILLKGETSTPENQQIVERLLDLYPVFMILSATVTAPFIEEFIFRGCIFTTFYKKHKFLAYVLSASLFGLMHTLPHMSVNFYEEAILSLSYISSGLLFTMICDKDKNVFSSMMMHSIVNSVAVLMILFVK